MIPYGRQSIDEDDIAAVVAVLKGDWLTQGPHIEEFEEALASRVGADHAVAFANGTAALHGACAAAGLGASDVVATSTLSFVASANCARYVGSHVRLLDIDESTWNVDPSHVPSGIDGLVAVHYAGLPFELDQLRHRPRVVIEDAAHAIGASTPDGPVGNCARSDMCCFSFHPVKTITTGEGGAVTTNDATLAERLRRFRSHGIDRRPDRGAWFYEVGELGFNYRITDLQAALGSSQLSKLDSFLARREQLARRYDKLLAELDVVVQAPPPEATTHGRHLYPVLVPDRARVFSELRERGVGAQVHYIPIHLHPVFASERVDQFPVANSVYDRLLSLPLYPSLSDADQEYVVASLAGALR